MARLTSEQLSALTRLGAHARLAELVAEMDAILDAFPDLGSLPARPRQGGSGPGPFKPGAKRGRRRPMSAAARKAVSERMKKYWAARRKAKK